MGSLKNLESGKSKLLLALKKEKKEKKRPDNWNAKRPQKL